LLLGSHGKRKKGRQSPSRLLRRSLPTVAATHIDSQYSLEIRAHFDAALATARDPSSPASQRMSDAAMALACASELGDLELLALANLAVGAVRHCPGVAEFDLHRADMIYSATLGDRAAALHHAEQLAEHCARFPEVGMACVGLRNAATVFSAYGNSPRAQRALHTSRELASRLSYMKQVVDADLYLAGLAIEEMDSAAARAYLQSARQLIDAHSLEIPMLHIDRALFSSWEAILSGDTARATQEARFHARATKQLAATSGGAAYTHFSLRLATHESPGANDFEEIFARVWQSIGRLPFYVTEDWSLAALLLASKKSGKFGPTAAFVESHRARIEARGKQLWPFVSQLMAQ
jgi:hypothetical protein